MTGKSGQESDTAGPDSYRPHAEEEVDDFFAISHVEYKSSSDTIVIEVHYIDKSDLPDELKHLADDVGNDYPYVKVFRQDEYIGEGILGYDKDGPALPGGLCPYVYRPSPSGDPEQILMLPRPIEKFIVHDSAD